MRKAILCLLAASALHGAGYGRLPLYFEANTGQADPNILFVSRSDGRRVFLTRDGASIGLSRGDAAAAVSITPLGALEATVSGEAERPAKSRYYLGGKTATARQFARVRYAEVYPGVDLLFYGNPRHLEYDFVVEPGADPQDIRLRVAGAQALRLDDTGDLVIETAAGDLRMLDPMSYQRIDGERRQVESAFRIEGVDTVAFDLGEYDRAAELVIDPVLIYAGYLGGGGADIAADVVVNRAGETFVVGMTRSLNFPTTPGAVQENFSGGSCAGGIALQPCFDVFAAKLNAAGSDIEWATYYGGLGNDIAAAASLADDGTLWIVGHTNSDDFPVPSGAAQTEGRGRNDAFALRLGPNGERRAATLIGGSDAEIAVDIAALEDGGAVAVGHTKSTDLPATDGFQRDKRGVGERTDVFVTRVGADAGSLRLTYLGGSGDDQAGGVAIGRGGQIWVAGATGSRDFPVTDDAIQGALASDAPDAFLAVFNTVSGRPYATYFGGSGADATKRVEADADGRVYVLGSTESRDFPTTRGAALPVWKRSLTFLARFSNTAQRPDYSTYLLGSAQDLAVDAEGQAWAAGVTGAGSPIFGSGALPACNGNILRKISAEGSRLLFSGFIPGLGEIDVDPEGFLYTAGADATGGLRTTPDSFNQEHAGQSDVYLAKMAIETDRARSITCVENGASFYAGEVAPGEIVTLFGSGLGPEAPAFLEVSEGGFVKSDLAGVRVLFDGVPGPLVYVEFNQINVVAPYALAGKSSTMIQLERDGELSDAFEAPVVDAHPGLFTRDSTGAGPAAIVNQDGTINTPENPAAAGSVVSLFGTGEGQTEPAGVDGLVTPETIETLPRPRLPVRVTIGNVEAEVTYAGAAPGFVSGVLQINVRIPAGTAPGLAPVQVTVGSRFNRQTAFVAVE